VRVFKPQFPHMARYLGTSDRYIVSDLQAEFPLLARCVETLTLRKVSYHGFHWTCTNASAAVVGLLPERVGDIVRRKGNKPYRWARNGEKWLLICASGESVVATAGPPPTPAEWADLDLQAACKASPFDRVYFWDRPHRWHKRLK
jgi:hypothetical protein